MALESRQMLIDDLKLYSEGILNALKKEKLREAKEYIVNLTNSLDAISQYVDSHISYESDVGSQEGTPLDSVRSDAERAVLAARRAGEKAIHLEKAAKETEEESKRLKKAARGAKKEAEKASKAAQKAEKAESKAEREAKKAAELASKANQAARRS